ncbi:hypothetical protein CTEN210_16231 [Chaetoceros tenuissimus]|uniref:Helicase-associated domain-containing protein n=1 Tax=Chaetoceros tenuissimus TaxID=426638 RepID=A0AAD3DB68_9STRA|nr:hypothetical protein CTEN210_16231 [Chaetoceros tenuissimus]
MIFDLVQENNVNWFTYERRYGGSWENLSGNPKDDIWKARFDQLVAFKDKNGHTKVPKTNKELGTWVRTQRGQYKKHQKGIKSAMTKRRIKKLNGIGFIWDVFAHDWSMNYNALKEFKEERGHCHVSTLNSEYKKLGDWVSNQRTLHTQLQELKKTDANAECLRMTKDRIEKLNAIGFIWSSFEDEWMMNFEALKEFKEENGHCNVPQKYSKKSKLGIWVKHQRDNYKNGDLTKDRIEKLTELGFAWVHVVG